MSVGKSLFSLNSLEIIDLNLITKFSTCNFQRRLQSVIIPKYFTRVITDVLLLPFNGIAEVGCVIAIYIYTFTTTVEKPVQRIYKCLSR